jgi:low molecular weight phosphotyrosine protein phosphatase
LFVSAISAEVLWVVYADIAEAVFSHTLKERGLVMKVDSCGTAAYHVGDNPDPRSVKECNLNNVSVSHKARQLCRDDFSKFGYILVMDQSNLRDVTSRKPKNSMAIVQLFGDFDYPEPTIIEDPYYGGQEGFANNFEQCKRCSIGFLNHLGL